MQVEDDSSKPLKQISFLVNLGLKPIRRKMCNRMASSGPGRPLFVCLSALCGPVTWSTAELRSVANITLQPSQVVKATLTMVKR